MPPTWIEAILFGLAVFIMVWIYTAVAGVFL